MSAAAASCANLGSIFAVAHYDVPLPPQPFPPASVVVGPSDDPFVAAPQPQLPQQGVIPPAPQQGHQTANVPVQPQAPNAQLAPADQFIQSRVDSAAVAALHAQLAALPLLQQPAEWHHAQANSAAQIQNHPPLQQPAQLQLSIFQSAPHSQLGHPSTPLHHGHPSINAVPPPQAQALMLKLAPPQHHHPPVHPAANGQQPSQLAPPPAIPPPPVILPLAPPPAIAPPAPTPSHSRSCSHPSTSTSCCTIIHWTAASCGGEISKT
ncbi:hypothetical protein BU17DRAFT_88811 [Hysterangium stoloniferum]|nr:hypothetical protein BU17DRAFT_88811 [Hysterangium stoloniferum]